MKSEGKSGARETRVVCKLKWPNYTVRERFGTPPSGCTVTSSSLWHAWLNITKKKPAKPKEAKEALLLMNIK